MTISITPSAAVTEYGTYVLDVDANGVIELDLEGASVYDERIDTSSSQEIEGRYYVGFTPPSRLLDAIDESLIARPSGADDNPLKAAGYYSFSASGRRLRLGLDGRRFQCYRRGRLGRRRLLPHSRHRR